MGLLESGWQDTDVPVNYRPVIRRFLPVLALLLLVPAVPTLADELGRKEVAQCNGRSATIIGTSGPDTLYGTDGDDVIVGLGGNDTIRGRAGNDTICGGGGNDSIYGGPGQDWLSGSGGFDVVSGGGGTDYVSDNNAECTGERLVGCKQQAPVVKTEVAPPAEKPHAPVPSFGITSDVEEAEEAAAEAAEIVESEIVEADITDAAAPVLSLLPPAPTCQRAPQWVVEAIYASFADTPHVCLMADYIAYRESRWTPGIIGGPNRNGTYDYGLLQLNSAYIRTWAGWAGVDWNQWSDPYVNAKMARAVYDRAGEIWGNPLAPWRL